MSTGKVSLQQAVPVIVSASATSHQASKQNNTLGEAKISAPMSSNTEITPSEVSVLGIRVCTRHGVLWEMKEMLEFLEDARRQNLTHMIAEIFYDSNNSYCVITPHKNFEEITNDERHPLALIALKYISQFEWGGDMRHSTRSEKREAGFEE